VLLKSVFVHARLYFVSSIAGRVKTEYKQRYSFEFRNWHGIEMRMLTNIMLCITKKRTIVSNGVNKNPEWLTRGKTIKQLIKELQTFEDQDLEVKISVDGGESSKCISLVGKEHEKDKAVCLLINCE